MPAYSFSSVILQLMIALQDRLRSVGVGPGHQARVPHLYGETGTGERKIAARGCFLIIAFGFQVSESNAVAERSRREVHSNDMGTRNIFFVVQRIAGSSVGGKKILKVAESVESTNGSCELI